MNRIQEQAILKDLQNKIALVVGPRQTGKTWLTQKIAKNFKNPTYLNYDNTNDKEIIHNQNWLHDIDLLILDELHKMPDWKNYLKGIYDTKDKSLKVIVTGSARLDIFDQIGDSLAGRYYRHRLLPLTLSELNQVGEEPDIEKLINNSGYPEPYLSNSPTEVKRWRMQYINSLLSTDVFEFDQIQNIKAIQLVFKLLRSRVGSPISYQNIAEDVSVSPTTIKKYIQILEALYVIFRVTPYSKNIARSLLKEPKIYFYDTGLVEGDDGTKFENFTAVSLLKNCYAKVDYLAEEYKLHYLKIKDGHEVDFAIIKDDKIELIIDAKLSDDTLGKSLLYFQEKYKLPTIQLVKNLRNEYHKNNIKILKAKEFLQSLYM